MSDADGPRDAPPLLEMVGIEKSFPGVQALGGVDLQLRRGEVLALVGENGAGKSTLIKVLGGAHVPDAGQIRLHGRAATILSPIASQRAGIAVIYQEVNLVPGLSARENIFLGREHARAGFVDRGGEQRRATELFNRIGVDIDPQAPCGRLSVAQQQVVEIAKALSADAQIIVMDEPSATLSLVEVKKLFAVIRELTAAGIGVIYVSHRLEEVFEIAGRVTVLRDGAHVATSAVQRTTRPQLIEWMVGRKLEAEFPRRAAMAGGQRLRVRNLARGDKVRDVSFCVRGGEVLALTGLVGAGRTETARLVFGADRRQRGTIELDGRRLNIRNPRDAIAAGICLLTEDRKSQGLVLAHSVRDNFALPNLNALCRYGWLRRRQTQTRFAAHVDSLKIKLSHADEPARNLSGGNQQKVVLAKWLERNSEVIIFDEPTRGIDVGAKYEIYLLINRLAAQGKAIIMISSELPEVLGMADRILVMHAGRVRGEITDVRDATQEQIMEMAVG